MEKFLALLLFTYLSQIRTHANANEREIQQATLYEEVLERHVSSGQLNKDDKAKQKLSYVKSKGWQKKFNKQARGIASTLKASRKIIYLKNPPIEIPTQ